MSIKIGEYVRTKKQGIKRIDTIFENRPVNRYGYEIGSEWDGKIYSIIKTTEIIKHSFNILDLIEVGDYVNGKEVTDIRITCFDSLLYVSDKNEELHNNEIKSIVTKEQFQQISYKVEE